MSGEELDMGRRARPTLINDKQETQELRCKLDCANSWWLRAQLLSLQNQITFNDKESQGYFICYTTLA